MGKRTDLLVCHIPFHSERGFLAGVVVFRQVTWRLFSSVSVVGLSKSTCTHVPYTHPSCETIVYLKHINIYFWLKGHTVHNFKHLENHCLCLRVCEAWRMVHWPYMDRHNVRYLAGLYKVIYSLQWVFSPAGYWTCCSLCVAAGPTKDSTVITRN